jgi:hypothetical protein
MRRQGRQRPCGRWPQRAAGLALAMACAAGALAQTTPGPLPEGPGRVRGRVVHPDGPEHAAGVPVALYGLSPSGEAGVADTLTDTQGIFVFEGVSNDPQAAYLVGARYREIPFFGPRVVFEEGQTETDVIIDVRDPTSDASGVGVAEVIVQLEWVADRLAVQEIHRLRNTGGGVVVIDESAREGRAPFEAQLPEGARDFNAALAGFEDAVDERDGRIRFWGPLYPGGQDLRFQYTLPLASGEGEQTAVSLQLPMGADSLSVLTASGGPQVADAGELGPVEEIDLEGRRFLVRRVADIAPGARIGFGVALPATSKDASQIELERVDAWVEYDDAQLSVNLQARFVVAGNERVASRGGEPLLRLPLPEEAEVLELSGMAEGAARVTTGALELYGPFAPGEAPVSLRYRLPAAPDGAAFELRFPLEVKALNVLVADTGIEIESNRLHRRRPFRQGTRVYLHREAFNLDADEAVRVGLAPLEPSGLGNRASLGITFAAVVACALFLAQPLLRARSAAVEPEESALSIQREALYEAIRDLDHDFETGKLAEADHREMREAMRARAVELLRQERGGAAEEVAEARAAASCPSCAGPIDASWIFCAGCGARLEATG